MTATTLAWTGDLHYDGSSSSLHPHPSSAWRRMRTVPESEQEILRAFLAEEEAGLRTVRGWIARLVGSRWSFRDPEEVEQEIVLELLRLGRDGRIRAGSNFRAFVSTVARHTCVDLYRRQRLRATVETEDGFFESVKDPDPDPEQTARDRQRLQCVRFVLQALDTDCRDLLGRFFGDGAPGRDIAQQLGISPGNVRVRIHRCLEKARNLRREYLPEST